MHCLRPKTHSISKFHCKQCPEILPRVINSSSNSMLIRDNVFTESICSGICGFCGRLSSMWRCAHRLLLNLEFCRLDPCFKPRPSLIHFPRHSMWNWNNTFFGKSKTILMNIYQVWAMQSCSFRKIRSRIYCTVFWSIKRGSKYTCQFKGNEIVFVKRTLFLLSFYCWLTSLWII